ncbi:PREDICTED: TMV resistance protein N-like [Prunus mume]|uniref:TMV resistance protein N-like n=1 Tax=Prunus mume TaxID=102107 RepID=A0ABM0PA94_PRUMU|nr:PREDICTED: TMV resistance protein N-like [Prunus mume]
MQLSNKMDSNITTELVASSPSPSTNSWKYDVFLSFRGADTRYGFTDHLHSSLLRRGINTFMDDDQLERGQDISEVINPAIRESRIFIIIFSENYASSSWCLEELARIIEYKNPQQQIVIPVYYKVDPADVRNQKGPFGEAFVQHENRFKDDLEKVSRWRAALTEAANFPGMEVNNFGRESKFIHEITEMILQKLNRAYLTYETNYPVEIDSRIREMNDLLGDGVTDVRMVGIWGMGGIGKTTLAKAVYNSVAHKFEGSCFLGNVRENSEAPGGLVQLQKTLLHNILGLKISRVTDVYSGVNIIKSRLRHKRVLLIIDDVDDLNQLKYLAGSSDWFGVGSRIIITTRNLHLLHAHGVDFTYIVRELESDEALELFSSNAFPTNRLPDDYQVLARRFVGYAQGIPLALTAMGSLLYKKSRDEWQSILERYERAPASNIHEILKITKKVLDHHIKRPEENVLTNVEEHAGGLNEAESNELMLEQNDTISGTPEVERLQGKISETYNEVTGLNEVENTAKLLGVETFSSTQEEERIQGHINRTDDVTEPNEAESTSTQVVETVEAKILGTEDVTEQNEDENNVNLVEGDKTISSIQEEDLLGKTPGTDDALYNAETTKKLVDGDETNSSAQEEDRLQGKIQGTDDITEPNEAESTSTQVVETVEAKILGTEDVTVSCLHINMSAAKFLTYQLVFDGLDKCFSIIF